MARISRHFDDHEWDCRDGTRAPAAYRAQLSQLVFPYLDPLREMFGPVHVISGFRTLRHNAKVGGSARSMHLWIPGRAGAAADVVCRRGTPRDWYQLLEEHDPPGLALYSSFVHVDSRTTGRSRWAP